MNHLNCILVEGNVCFEPKAVCTSAKTSSELVVMRLASNRYYNNLAGQKMQDTLYIDVEAWGKVGKKALEYIQKGMSIRVVGRLRMNEYKTNDDKKCEKTVIVAEHIEFNRLKKSKVKGEEDVIEEVTIDADKEDSVCEQPCLYEF